MSRIECHHGQLKRACDRCDNEETIAALRARITDLERKNGELEKALESIADPIVHMQQEAEREGQRLDGMMAVILSEDPAYLKGIARAALTRTKEQK